jgi:hypothetical protein
MRKRFLASLLFSFIAGSAFAQDMPPLPPLPEQSQTGSPSSPATSPSAGPTATTDNNASGMPPLPGDSSAPAPPAPLTGSATAPANPPPPPASGDQNQAPANPPLPSESAAAPSTETQAPASLPAKKHPRTLKPWQVSRSRPNVIFGGWVRAKGGNESSRLAWTSQEILNALLFKKYKLISPRDGKSEEGSYVGQEGQQWRLFTFNVPKSKLAVQVYIRQAGKRVWLRVGPGEGVFPEATSLAGARKIREADLTALHLLQRKLGRRLSPHLVQASWEAPYRYAQGSADE